MTKRDKLAQKYFGHLIEKKAQYKDKRDTWNRSNDIIVGSYNPYEATNTQ